MRGKRSIIASTVFFFSFMHGSYAQLVNEVGAFEEPGGTERRTNTETVKLDRLDGRSGRTRTGEAEA